jgi:hypothetical protein
MKAFGTLIAAAAGLLLLSGTLAGESGPPEARIGPVAQAEAPRLPSWHPPVTADGAEDAVRHPSLPEGHPPIPKELVCPATGAVARPGQAPRTLRPPVEGLVRI